MMLTVSFEYDKYIWIYLIVLFNLYSNQLLKPTLLVNIN